MIQSLKDLLDLPFVRFSLAAVVAWYVVGAVGGLREAPENRVQQDPVFKNQQFRPRGSVTRRNMEEIIQTDSALKAYNDLKQNDYKVRMAKHNSDIQGILSRGQETRTAERQMANRKIMGQTDRQVHGSHDAGGTMF